MEKDEQSLNVLGGAVHTFGLLKGSRRGLAYRMMFNFCYQKPRGVARVKADWKAFQTNSAETNWCMARTVERVNPYTR